MDVDARSVTRRESTFGPDASARDVARRETKSTFGTDARVISVERLAINACFRPPEDGSDATVAVARQIVMLKFVNCS